MRLLLFGFLGIYACCAVLPAQAEESGAPHIVRMGVKKTEAPLSLPDKDRMLQRLSGQKREELEQAEKVEVEKDSGTVDEKQKPSFTRAQIYLTSDKESGETPKPIFLNR